MDMFDAGNVFLNNRHRVFARICEVAGVKEQGDILGIRPVHQALGLGFALDNRAHVMMESEADAVLFLCDLTEPVKAFAQGLPLVVIHHVFVSEDRCVHLSLYAVALFREADDL